MRICCFVGGLVTTALSTAAFAQERGDLDGRPGRDALPALVEGGFVPFTATPGAPGHRVTTFTSYDSASNAAQLETMLQMQVLPMLQIAANVDLEDAGSAAAVSAQLDITNQDDAGFDSQVALGWAAQGINGVTAAFGEVAAGTRVGASYVLGSARFDYGTAGEEAGLRLAAASVRPLVGRFVGGIDSRIDIDLTRGEPEPMDESGWSVQAGPVIGYAYEMIAITASVGIAAAEPRVTGNTEVGAYAGAGLGVTF